MRLEDYPAAAFMEAVADFMLGAHNDGKSEGSGHGAAREARPCPGGCGRKTRLRLCGPCETAYRVQKGREQRAKQRAT